MPPSLNSVKYSASMDRLATIVTLVSILLFVFMGLVVLNDLLKTPTDGSSLVLQGGAILLLVSIPLVCWLFSTRHYTLNNEMLTIHRPALNRRIPLSTIQSAQTVAREEMKGSLRTFAVGGLFGYFGKFMVPKFGAVNAYTTQMKNLVLLTTIDGEQILLSPDDVGFVKQLTSLKGDN